MKAEDYITTWCDKTYPGAKELGDWTTNEVMKFANDFAKEKMRVAAPSIYERNNLPEDVRYASNEGVELYRCFQNYLIGVLSLEEFITDTRKIKDKYGKYMP